MVTGDLAFQREHYREALEFYRKALQLKPSDATIRKKLAVTLTLLGEPDGARQYRK
jgi:Flp pilus assembly protein TadD